MCLEDGLAARDADPRARSSSTPRRPSEYAATNVWMGNSFQSRQEAEAAIAIGREDRFMWGSDYPHPEGTYIYTDDESRRDPRMTRLVDRVQLPRTSRWTRSA